MNKIGNAILILIDTIGLSTVGRIMLKLNKYSAKIKPIKSIEITKQILIKIFKYLFI